MILKVQRKKIRTSEDGLTGSTQHISEFYDGDIKINHDDMIAIIDADKNVHFGDYSLRCEITSDIIEYKTTNVYLMNDNGQTIERIV